MSLSNYLENNLLDHIRGSAYSVPAGLYLKLHLGDPGEDCTANPAAETTRKAATFNAASGGSMALSSTVEWTDVSDTEDMTHFSVWDTVGPAGGNPLGSGALSATVNATVGDTVRITAATWSLE